MFGVCGYFFFFQAEDGIRDKLVTGVQTCASDLGAGAPQDAALSLWEGGRERRDTLRFDAGGRAELRLAPGVYRYAAAAPPSARGGERGLVAVEMNSDEWRAPGAARPPPRRAPPLPPRRGGGRGR